MLNSDTLGNLTHWTEAELYEFADENLKRLARTAAVYVDRTTTENAPADSAHPLAATDIAVIDVGWDGVALSPSNMRELEALDQSWEAATPDTPSHFATDFLGFGTVRLYPPPAATGTLDLITIQTPPEVSSGSPDVRAPLPFAVWLRARLLVDARGSEGDGAMPEVAQRFGELASIIERVTVAYYGGSQ